MARSLDALAARVPAPGGGAVAALHAAQAAALIGTSRPLHDGREVRGRGDRGRRCPHGSRGAARRRDRPGERRRGRLHRRDLVGGLEGG
ncbi:cyclodeaminase/cyclohydrolase family protein [Streptomyces sp. NPDC048290]|uniref:cyclodeaminase/cyclohydrolase family protein n=1 Tax=Streptomyces sp. NPDC048290 TaxID=3155811 RepID=UPI003433A332